MKKLSIIIPCKNEEDCINIFYSKTQEIVSKIDVNVEYIFVDDGSKDKTLELIKGLAKTDKHVRYVSFSRNFGKEAALYAGLKNATGDLIAVMDADLQDPPELLYKMFNGLVNEDYDCVACRRTNRKGEPPIRSLFAKLFYKLINKFSAADIVDGARDYRMMTRKMVDAILSMEEVDRFSKGIFGWVGFKIKWLDYENVDRVAGKTKWSFKKLMKYAIGGIEDFSTAPLYINLLFSVFSGFSFLVLLIFDIVIWCCGNRVSIFLGLVTIGTFMLSMIFFGLFVQGEYIKKIFVQSKKRPIYIEKENEKDLNID